MLFPDASTLTFNSAGEERSNNQYSSNAYIAQYKGAAPRPTNSIGAARPRRITHEEKVEQEKQMQHQMELEQAGMREDCFEHSIFTLSRI